MTLYLSNRDGNGKTNEEGHYKFTTAVFVGNVLDDASLKVTQNSTPNMSVLVAAGQFKIDTTGYSYTGWNNVSTAVAINTANPANPRITSVVVYVDKGASTSASPPNNPGIVKFITVDGTPAASPIAPSAGTIQTAVGAGNPYIILANITVATGATQILNASIADQRIKVTVGTNLISTASLQDLSVTSAKIANGAVGTNQLADASVTLAKLVDGSITDQKWRNNIAFFAKRTGTRSVTAGTGTKISANSITYNYGNGYSNTSDIGRFTAPVSGIYSFMANVFSEATTQPRCFLYLRYNGVTDYRLFDQDTSYNRRMNGAMTLLLNAGDYIEPMVWLQNTADISSTTETWVEGHIITRI